MTRIPLPEAFDFLRRRRLAQSPHARDGFGNRLTRGFGASAEAVGVRPWDESATRMAAVASGRLGYPVALEMPRESLAELFVLFDHRSCLAFGSAEQTVRERIITLGLALALVALHDGWRIYPVVFCDQGFLPLPPCSRPGDWMRLRHRLETWPESTEVTAPAGRAASRALGLPGFCLCSDADPDAAINSLATRCLGRIRVYDPWEQSPPRRAKVPLWGPRTMGQESWWGGAARDQARLEWERRDRLWEQGTSAQRFAQLSHATDQAWQHALDPWLTHAGGRPS